MKKMLVFWLLCLAFAGESKAADIGFYSIGTDGNLYLYVPSDGTNQKVGTGWGQFKHVFSIGGGIIYAIDTNGRLLWYRHDGALTRSEQWSGGQEISKGWGHFTQVFSVATTGIIYAIDTNGNLYRYNHTGWLTGAATWENWNPPPIGNGWGGFTKVFACDGDIYGINTNGDLIGYQIDLKTGAFLSGPIRVGEGWGGFTDVWGTNGKIYAVTPQKIFVYYVPKTDNQILGAKLFDTYPSVPNPNPTQTRWFDGMQIEYWDPSPPKPPIPIISSGRYSLYVAKENKYVKCDPSGAITTENQQYRSIFDVQVLSQNNMTYKIAIKGPNGKYMVAEGNSRYFFNRDAVGAWETFRVEFQDLWRNANPDKNHKIFDAHNKILGVVYDPIIIGGAILTTMGGRFSNTPENELFVLMKE
jgi:hypothetical protein